MAREAFIWIVGGLVLAIGAVAIHQYSTRLPFQFSSIELGYIPAADHHRVYVGLSYTYNGGCTNIAWTHAATDGDGKVYLLESYDGPVRWPETGVPSLYQTVIHLEKPLPQGHYIWRGFMVCTFGDAGDAKQVPIWTSIEDLYVDHTIGTGPGRTPLSWRPEAFLFTPL